jgi:hypothetical protein
VDVDDTGVRITVSTGWVTLDLTHNTVDQLLHNAEKEHSSADRAAVNFLKQNARSLSKNVLLYACKPRGDTCHDNVVIVLLPGAPPSPVGHEEEVRAAYAGNGASRNVSVSDTLIDKTAALQVLSEGSSVVGPSRTLHGTGYVLPGRTGEVEIDFTTDGDGRYDADVQSMVHSIRLQASGPSHK